MRKPSFILARSYISLDILVCAKALPNEGRRFYDIRRWGIYEEEENKPIEGMNITGDQYDFYQRSVVTHADYRNRVVDRKTVFLPIPRDEMRKASKLDQNPGWDD